MKTLILSSHVIAGTLVLLLGFTIMILKKGTVAHKKSGLVYVYAMWWLCLSAFIHITFFRFSIFLMVIGILTFHASYSGYRIVKRKNTGKAKWYDWMVSAITLAFGLGLVGYGAYLYFLSANYMTLAILSVAFGALTFNGGFQDLREFANKNPEKSKNWWLRQHISAMGGSYIAAITAFAVQNGNYFLPEFDHNWLFWVLPGIIGAPIISLVSRKYKEKSIIKSNVID